ncbi:MAG: hypothetical protein J5856_00485 [Lachnospiraceae bacterium]|nr:hypothetical protein [Lachnospiraceae bacterium]
MRKLKKLLCVLTVLLTMTQFLACGKNTEAVPITSDWKAQRIEHKGFVTDLTKGSDDLNDDLIPMFFSDGKDFTFILSGKEHKGYLEQKGNDYELHWDQNQNPRSPELSEATIDGSTLTIDYAKDYIFVFKAK